MRIDALTRKTHPKLHIESRSYPEMLGYFLKHILGATVLEAYAKVIVITARFKAGAQRKEFERTVKITLARMLPKNVKWRVLYHSSYCNFDLQVADYCCWAIYRKWNKGDSRSYNLIAPAIRKEFDIFQRGDTYYY